MKKKIHPNKATPLYAQVAEDLRMKILTEEWKPGDKIPPELDLCDMYHVSRITIRKSIDDLVRENLVYRERAKGTFVCDWVEEKEEQFTLVRGFTNEMKELGKVAKTTYADIMIDKADKKVSKYIGIKLGDSVMVLRRIRGTQEKEFVYSITYFPYSSEYSTDSNDYYSSFYAYLREFGINVNQEKEYIEAVLPSTEIQEMLHVDRHKPILKRVRFAKQLGSSFREYSENYYIGSHYRYYIDFS